MAKMNPYKELKKKYDKNWMYSDIWNFILKEVIPMAESKTRKQIIKEIEGMKIKLPDKKDISFNYDDAWSYNQAIDDIINQIKK